MTCLDFCESTTDGLDLPLLFLNVNLNGVGDEVVRAPARSLGQPLQLLLNPRRETDANGCSSRVSHEYKLARCPGWVKLLNARAPASLSRTGQTSTRHRADRETPPGGTAR